MKNYRLILLNKKLRYFPAILTSPRSLKQGESVLVYIPTLPVDPNDQDQEPIVSEDD